MRGRIDYRHAKHDLVVSKTRDTNEPKVTLEERLVARSPLFFCGSLAIAVESKARINASWSSLTLWRNDCLWVRKAGRVFTNGPIIRECELVNASLLAMMNSNSSPHKSSARYVCTLLIPRLAALGAAPW